MSYRLHLTPGAADDLQRLFDFLAEQDLATAERARTAIARAFDLLREFPFACRKIALEHPLLREMVIGFGRAGYVALYEMNRRLSLHAILSSRGRVHLSVVLKPRSVTDVGRGDGLVSNSFAAPASDVAAAPRTPPSIPARTTGRPTSVWPLLG